MRIIITFLFLAVYFNCKGQDYFELASREYFYGDLHKCIPLFDKAIENRQEVAKSYMYRGAAKAFLKMFDEAAVDLDSSKRYDSSNAKIYYYLGKLHLFKGEYKQAIRYYDQSIKGDKKDAFSYNERGTAKAALGNFAEAIKDEDIAISIDSSREYFFNDRGFVRLELKQYPLAIGDFSMSLTILPNQKAYANRGYANYLLCNYKEAIPDFTMSLSINSNDPEVYYFRGVSYRILGDMEDACSDLNRSKTLGYEKASAMLKELKCQTK